MSIILLFFLLCCIVMLLYVTSPTVHTKPAKFPLHLFLIVFFCSCVSISCLLHQHKRKRKKEKKEHIRGTALVKRGAFPFFWPPIENLLVTHTQNTQGSTQFLLLPETADVRRKRGERTVTTNSSKQAGHTRAYPSL